jgi:hypothetical protein
MTRRRSAEVEIIRHGAVDFHDLVETDDEPVPFHRLDLTEGEAAVLRDLLAYMKQRFNAEISTVRASGTTRVDFASLYEKAMSGKPT